MAEGPALPVRVDVTRLDELLGRELGPGEPVVVTQGMIDGFARATGDAQWIHVDPQRARRGPYGTTIAHGHLTLSLVPVLVRGVLVVEGIERSVNYGLDRVRFPAPAPVGCALAATVVPLALQAAADGAAQLSSRVTVTPAAATGKPCCVADTIVRYYPRRL